MRLKRIRTLVKKRTSYLVLARGHEYGASSEDLQLRNNDLQWRLANHFIATTVSAFQGYIHFFSEGGRVDKSVTIVCHRKKNRACNESKKSCYLNKTM